MMILVGMAVFNLISFGYLWYAVRGTTAQNTGLEMYNQHMFAVYANGISQAITLLAAAGATWVAVGKNKAAGYR